MANDFDFKKLGTVPLKIGKTFYGSKEQKFHTIAYDFMPTSIDQNEEVLLDVNDNNKIAAKLSHSQNANQQTEYYGSQKPHKNRCVLIFDRKTGEVTLEKLTADIVLKRNNVNNENEVSSDKNEQAVKSSASSTSISDVSSVDHDVDGDGEDDIDAIAESSTLTVEMLDKTTTSDSNIEERIKNWIEQNKYYAKEPIDEPTLQPFTSKQFDNCSVNNLSDLSSIDDTDSNETVASPASAPAPEPEPEPVAPEVPVSSVNDILQDDLCLSTDSLSYPLSTTAASLESSPASPNSKNAFDLYF